MANIDCTPTIITSSPFFNADSLLNPFYTTPGADDPESAFVIKIFYGDEYEDFAPFYFPGTLEIEDNRGFERGNAKFRITDYNPNKYNLPLMPTAMQMVEIWNKTEDDIFFSGMIISVEPSLIVRRADGTEVTFYDINCSDNTVDFERILVTESYNNVPTGFIIRDLVNRFTFLDASGIDPTKGLVIKSFRSRDEYVGDLIQRALDIEPTWIFWVDRETKTAHAGEATEVGGIVQYLNEDNVYDIFDAPQLKIAYDEAVIRNRVRFWYRQRYSAGTVSVTTGMNVVFGQGTQFLNVIKANSELRVNGSESVYTIQRVNNDTEIILSSPYQEDIETAVPYEIVGSESAVIVEDKQSILKMATVKNESMSRSIAGVWEYKVPEDNNAYTRDEAVQIAKAHLLRFLEPFIKGSAKTNNAKLTNAGMSSGMAFYFNLPTSKKVVAEVVIQQIRWKDTGGIIYRSEYDPTDTRIDPLMEMEIDFQDRVFDIRNQVKRLMADVRRSVVGDDIDVFSVFPITEQIYVSDCVHLIEPVGGGSEAEIRDNTTIYAPSNIIDDELGIGDSAELTEMTAGQYRAAPVSPGNNVFCATGATRFSNVS